MAKIGGGKIVPLGGASTIQLTSSTATFDIKDVDGFPLFKLDANGNLYLRGGVKKI